MACNYTAIWIQIKKQDTGATFVMQREQEKHGNKEKNSTLFL